MKILAVDTSAKVTSVCVTEDNRILAEFNANTSLTHSQSLLPMVDGLLKSLDLSINEIDAFACSKGPGSFTGLRIGISAIKGFAYGNQKPCAGVSTLNALAYNLIGTDAIICPAMDARCNQVYTALFESSKAGLNRIMEDTAIPISELSEKLKAFDKDIILVGDGADLCYKALSSSLDNLYVASEQLKYQKAASVAMLAKDLFENSELSFLPEDLVPAYIRLPQAQRELLKKMESGKTDGK